MSGLRSIAGPAGFVAHQLGRFGEPTGGWRIERNGVAIFDCASEVDARIAMKAVAHITIEQWAEATRAALADMGQRRAA